MLGAEVAATALERVGGFPQSFRILLFAGGLQGLQMRERLFDKQANDFAHRIRLTGRAQLAQSLQRIEIHGRIGSGHFGQ